MIPVSSRASTIEYAIRDVVVPATKLEAEGHEIIKLNITVNFYQLKNLNLILRNYLIFLI